MPDAASSALITDDAAILGLLAATLGAVFWAASRESGFWSRFYNYVPAILMCYLVPAIYNSIGLIDGGASNLSPIARDYLLPASQSDERRVGKERCSTCSARCSPSN